MPRIWNVFDPQADVIHSARNLPHWDQTTALTFVTMRLADSMPKKVVQLWHQEIETWLRKTGLENRTVEEILNDTTIDAKLKSELKRFKHRRWHSHLDDCHGACVFRNPLIAAVTGNALLHFKGARYDLERFIIMPNHAHLLIQMRAGFDLRSELSGVMRYSARVINQMLEQKGAFWQAEPFDHIVRSERQFHYLQDYIVQNPVKAKLRRDEYLYWQCEDE